MNHDHVFGEEQYARALEWIHGIGRFGMKPGLGRITALLERLGNPHRSLRFLHIGGTNGKGSTAAMIAGILEAAGYRIGLYTSPYLVSFTNRMAVNGAEIDPAELTRLVEQVRPLVEEIAGDPEQGQLTEFEVVTALAFLYFCRQAPDLVVLEVGLGGRLDATNVVRPEVCIITNISLDHTAVLGNTVEAVAREKAGIIKPGAPVVTAATDRAALEVITRACLDRHVPCYRAVAPGTVLTPRDKRVGIAAFDGRKTVPAGQCFNYRGLGRSFENIFIPLLGKYQCLNATTALIGLELLGKLGFPVTEEAVRRGLAGVCWPGRLEVLGRNPLLVLDGAHNPAAMQELVGAVADHFSGHDLILVLGFLADKEWGTMLRDLLPLARQVFVTEPDNPRACPAEQLANAIREHFSGSVFVYRNTGDAVQKALSAASPDSLVLITGSLYLVSEARRYLVGMKSGR